MTRCVNLSTFKSYTPNGDVRLLAVTGEERDSNYPDVPTFKELGYDFDASVYFRIVAPDGLDPEIITILPFHFGAIPGLTVTTALAMFTLLTYALSHYTAFGFPLGVYCGGYYAGSIPAILIKTPGAPGNAATCVDGYPIRERGQAGKALSLSGTSSMIGGIFSALVLMVFDPMIGQMGYLLPELVFPMYLLCLGYPESIPEQRPRLDTRFIFDTNAYPALPTAAELQEYDTEVSQYFFRTTNGRSDQGWVARTQHAIEVKPRYSVGKFLEQSGFLTQTAPAEC